MLVLLFALAAIALTLLAVLFAGAVIAIATGIALVNVFVLIVGLLTPRPDTEERVLTRWQPSSFRLPPVPDDESEEQLPALKVHRL
jgi:hypothetical protein